MCTELTIVSRREERGKTRASLISSERTCYRTGTILFRILKCRTFGQRFVCLPVCLPVCLSVCLKICLSLSSGSCRSLPLVSFTIPLNMHTHTHTPHTHTHHTHTHTHHTHTHTTHTHTTHTHTCTHTHTHTHSAEQLEQTHRLKMKSS